MLARAHFEVPGRVKWAMGFMTWEPFVPSRRLLAGPAEFPFKDHVAVSQETSSDRQRETGRVPAVIVDGALGPETYPHRCP